MADLTYQTTQLNYANVTLVPLFLLTKSMFDLCRFIMEPAYIM